MRVTLPLTDGGTVIMGNGPSIYFQGICLRGAMCTGWNQIDGKWYYFSQEQGSGYGQLLTGTTTQDGYTVNENGEWVQ